jgi:hypothetical protein
MRIRKHPGDRIKDVTHLLPIHANPLFRRPGKEYKPIQAKILQKILSDIADGINANFVSIS